MSFSETFWDVFWWFFVAYAFIAYFYVLFAVISDLFRDRKLNAWLKVVWMIFLIFIPFLTVVIYMVVRGATMGERSREVSRSPYGYAQASGRHVATISPREEISKAKALLDSGVISAEEFARIKSAVQA
ncbi:SHOCT domain-containing protein [Arthrobacter pigmenti]